MIYHSNITVETNNPKILIDVFQAELETAKNSRSEWDMVSRENCVIFNFHAKDSVALRAVMNSITKLLTVYEKLKDLDA